MQYLLLLLLFISADGYSADPLRVAVAANFRATLQQITEPFQQRTGYRVVLSSGSTGVLYSQILHGAPFDIFFAADKASTEKLAAGGVPETLGQPFCYARGALVLAGGEGGTRQLADPGLTLAIANPTTAPYGEAALEVLERPEFATGRSRKLVRGTNVVQALQFWRSGGTDLALLPLALAPDATPVPEAWHQPLDQFAITLSPLESNPALASYLNWIRSDTVRSLIFDAGYKSCP